MRGSLALRGVLCSPVMRVVWRSPRSDGVRGRMLRRIAIHVPCDDTYSGADTIPPAAWATHSGPQSVRCADGYPSLLTVRYAPGAAPGSV
ncbi:MAG: hypothetical protein OXH15_04315 [Gammaproteobacteria bacterium]|nr:hypothetical protein [Gammaproteobacteria bacterium]